MVRTGDPARRLLTDPVLWLTVALLVVCALCAVALWFQVVPDREVPGGTLIGLGTDAIPKVSLFAAYSLVPISLLYFWADRWRPVFVWTRIGLWVAALAWGAFVSTFLSAQLNTWAASRLAIEGDGDPASGARAAVFVAPFVEESTKATILFFIAILLRYRFVNRLSGIVLAGLAGAGFAFTENILYYGRAYRYAAQTFGQQDPDEVLRQIFFLRGVMTPFAHPLFTMCTGIGLAVALRAKSKLFRVLAPLIGFLAAALLHMAFNASSTLFQGTTLLLLWGVALMLVGTAIGFIIRQLLHEGRSVRARLEDYVRSGWLETSDAEAASRLRTRMRALWHALWRGPSTFWSTIVYQVSLTELAYLRDSQTRGLVDRSGTGREHELLATVTARRPHAVVLPDGRAPYPRLRRRKAVQQWAPPAYPGPSGLGGSWPAPPGATASQPLGQTATQYSEVDPSWAPPKS
ncbi:Membrane proteinase PrsW, cleaves anti-sigma factor RsiW, M82 family [Auraticoccus monumenti]|uniref:Membrane proteinase PrsW, cleaves anti-sigma factor RsiW, M82 family n=1 Tax=Auraticoccus monumenti TaxID=675864 RepID=A0A1G7EXK2_9ACTN|nr:Membrane proteinase PrsW, cleaves anti-sigma factor RsiW, M82 family [Auraticoccus monumenti]